MSKPSTLRRSRRAVRLAQNRNERQERIREEGCDHPREERYWINRMRGSFRCLKCGYQFHEIDLQGGV